MLEFLELVFWGNTVKSYLFFIGSFAVGVIVLFIIKTVILKRLFKRVQKTRTNVDETIVRDIIKYLIPVLYFSVFYISTKFLYFNETVAGIIDIVFTAWSLFFGALLISRIFVCFFNRYWEKKREDAEKMSVKWLAVVIKIVIWTAALILFLENIGVEITALIAGLGIGGIAVAFAAQSLLEDVFSFITIFFDRPFEIGDNIVIDDLMGTVEHTGIKTTRIRSLSGEQLVLPNKDLTNSRLKNYQRMENRRIAFKIGITYDTPLEKLKEIPLIIENIISTVEGVQFDRSHFAEFADFCLNFATVYYVLSSDYGVYMDVQQEINFRIMEEFKTHDIEFAFPTQTLHIHSISGSQKHNTN